MDTSAKANVTASFEEMKAEAVNRMKKLWIYDYTINQFEEDNLVSISEPPSGAYYWVEDVEKEFIEFIKREHKVLIYTGMRSRIDIGDVISYLYVSSDKDKWPDERKELENLESMSCVHSLVMPQFYEFSHISFKQSSGGGLLRQK